MKKTFLKRFATSKEGDRPIQRLQDMRQQRGEALKTFLSRFTDEMTYCVQVTDREALTALRGGLDMNSLFWRDVQNKDPTTYDALLEMIRQEILNEELKDHRNRASRGLPPPQMQRGKGPTSHLMDHQAPLNHGQELAAATLNAVPTLAYEEVNPGAEMHQRQPYQRPPQKGQGRGRGAEPRDRDEAPNYCSYHQSHGHRTENCWDVARHSRNQNQTSGKHPSRNTPYKLNRPPGNNERRRTNHNDHPQRREGNVEEPRESQRHGRGPQPSNEPVREIDTIIGGPHMGGDSRNSQKNYAREATDPAMSSYIVNQSTGRSSSPITFTQEEQKNLKEKSARIRVTSGRKFSQRL